MFHRSAKLLLAGLLAWAVTGCAVDADDVDQQEDNFTQFPSGDPPSDSDWAKGRIGKACDVELSDDVLGVITDTDGFTYGNAEFGAGVIYEAELDGEVVAAAYAKNTFILTRVTCLD